MEIPDDRELTDDERALTRWLLQHGVDGASDYDVQLANARVVSRCACGCASVNFAIPGRTLEPEAGLTILADFQWRDRDHHLGGVFVFAKNTVLAGLEVWSIDGDAEINLLPDIADLHPIDTQI